MELFLILNIILFCISLSVSLFDDDFEDPILHDDRITTGGTIPVKVPYTEIVSYADDKKIVPESFDARKAWPKCADIINTITIQGECNNCWAHVAAAVLSNRLCIRSDGNKVKVLLSVHELTTCCNRCWAKKKPGGCLGGFLSRAFEYYIKSGGVTGESNLTYPMGCQPLTKRMVKHAEYYTDYPRGECRRHCTNHNYSSNFEKDKYFALKQYSIKGEKAIQKEIMSNGPVASVVAYCDEGLFEHKMEIYHNENQSEINLQGHSVRIIGWGEKKSGKQTEPYWLVASTFGMYWGDHGTFKIRRGTDECKIESFAEAVAPRADSLAGSRQIRGQFSAIIFLNSLSILYCIRKNHAA